MGANGFLPLTLLVLPDCIYFKRASHMREMNLILSRQKNCQWNSGWEHGWLIKLSSWSWQELEEEINSLLFPHIRQWRWLIECRRGRQDSIWKHCNISEWWKCRLSMIGKQCKRQMTSLSLSLSLSFNTS